MEEVRRREIVRLVAIARWWMRVSLAGIVFGLLSLGVYLYAQYAGPTVGPLADSSVVAVVAFALLGLAVLAITQLQRTLGRIRGMAPPADPVSAPN